MYPIIGLAGNAGSGKNTVAGIISKTVGNVAETSFAVPFKKAFLDIFVDIKKEWLFGPSELRLNKVTINLGHCYNAPFQRFCEANSLKEDIWISFVKKNQDKELTIRELLQFFGTEFGRSQNPNIWADLCIKEAKNLLIKNNLVVITDVRFKNEALAVKESGGLLISIDNLSKDTKDTHQSETELAKIPLFWYDDSVMNEKNGMTLLEGRVERMLERQKIYL